MAMIYSTSRTDTASLLTGPGARQFIYALLGLILMMAAASTDYRLWGHIAPFLYVLMLALLIAVMVVGESSYGSRRWIDLAIFPLQPSEVAKLLMVIVLAKYLADHHKVKRLSFLLVSLLIVIVPAALVYFQPDLGTLMVFPAIWLGMVTVAGARSRHLLALAGTVAVAIPVVYRFVLHGYMRERIAVFLNPGADPLGAGYHTIQSEISVGSGGLWGKGFASGTQSQLNFLPHQTSDFIFSVVAEELGFVGAFILLALFLILLFRGLRIAVLARDGFGQLVAAGIVTMILSQIIINVGVNLRLLPITGIPLPFISYGGSSLITSFIALGILQSILTRHRRISFSG